MPFRLTYQTPIQIELVTNVCDRSGDNCHLGHGVDVAKVRTARMRPVFGIHQSRPSRTGRTEVVKRNKRQKT